MIKTKGKALEAIRRSLKAKNAKFRKLTKPQQRVAIAKDVISQISLEKIQARSTYFSWGDGTFDGEYNDAVEKVTAADLDMSECVSQTQCEVCGIGGLFVGAVRLADKLKFNDFSGGRAEEMDYLNQWFSDEQLDMVEDYYERNDYNEDGESPIRDEDDRNRRLTMIMENIISNRGRFNPARGAHKDVQ